MTNHTMNQLGTRGHRRVSPDFFRMVFTVPHGMILLSPRIRCSVGCCASCAASVPRSIIVASLPDVVYDKTIMAGGSIFVTIIERYWAKAQYRSMKHSDRLTYLLCWLRTATMLGPLFRPLAHF